MSRGEQGTWAVKILGKTLMEDTYQSLYPCTEQLQGVMLGEKRRPQALAELVAAAYNFLS